MAEAQQYVFTYEEIAEALVKKQGIHEGLWAILVEFGIQGANASGAGPGEIVPVAVVPVVKFGLQRVKPGAKMPGVVDAAAVNPTPKPS